MTVANFGQIVPSQMGMLMLSGYRLTRENGRTEMLRCDEAAKVVTAMKEGRQILEKITKHDFGYSLDGWHNFLINDAKNSHGYMRSSTWGGVERAVKAEIENPDRASLEALANQT